MTPPISPQEQELIETVKVLREANPTLGVPKFLALLTTQKPEWTVSEKRLRKVMQQEGLMLSSTSNAQGTTSNEAGEPAGEASINSTEATPSSGKGGGKKKKTGESKGGLKHPESRLNSHLDVSKWSKSIQVVNFGPQKGKGLVATELIPESTVIWKEDPSILAPEWAIYDFQYNSRSCAHCSTPLSMSNPVISCGQSSSHHDLAHPCSARFCNRLCYKRSETTHPFLCPTTNPASTAFLKFCRQNEWMAPHSLARFTAKILSANQTSIAELDEVMDEWRSYAMLGMEDRVKNNWEHAPPPDRAMWKKAHEFYLSTFRDAPTPDGKKKLARLLKRPLPDDISEDLFSYEGFLRGLGRVSLNNEAHGGLYKLHSHINHSCTPNVSVRHLDQRTALARISVLALRDIPEGEELLATYVNPDEPAWQRRRSLREWGFGRCECERCLREEKTEVEGEIGGVEVGGSGGGGGGVLPDLERELKERLGL